MPLVPNETVLPELVRLSLVLQIAGVQQVVPDFHPPRGQRKHLEVGSRRQVTGLQRHHGMERALELDLVANAVPIGSDDGSQRPSGGD
jgi:hypothetical protein